jgi:hypothetical protein
VHDETHPMGTMVPPPPPPPINTHTLSVSSASRRPGRGPLTALCSAPQYGCEMNEGCCYSAAHDRCTECTAGEPCQQVRLPPFVEPGRPRVVLTARRRPASTPTARSGRCRRSRTFATGSSQGRRLLEWPPRRPSPPTGGR